MPIPEHRSLTRSRVDENHGELVRRARDRARPRDVDAGLHETLPRHRPQRIRSEGSDVGGLEAELGARRQRRADLPARHVHEPLQPLLAVARRVFGDDGEEVDAVESESSDVEWAGADLGNLQTEPHVRILQHYRARAFSLRVRYSASLLPETRHL